MSKTSNILLILLTCIFLSACQEDDFRPAMEQAPDMESVIAQGKYLAARNAETYSAIVDPEKGTWFPIGTPFRLLAFTKPYVKDAPDYETDPAKYHYATTPRFNEVAWEGEILVYGDTIRYINVNDTPDKLFGFTALTSADGSLSEETGDAQDNLVALDFYGFTYGKKVDSRDNYIPLDKINGIEPLDEAGNGNPTDPPLLDELKRTESVSADGESLNDLLRGALFNRDIHNAGISDNIATQSILPFKHCFSKLQFMVVQQPKDNDAESEDKKDNIDFNNSTEPSFDNLYVEDVKVTGTYGSGSVYLKDGKVELSGDPINRPLKIKDSYKGPVTTTQVEIGEMILFPSANSALKGKESTPDGGYTLGLEITVRCPEKKTLENFIRNTSGREPLENEIETVTVDDKTYYRCTVTKAQILNSNYDDIDDGKDIVPLYLKQNTSYTIVIAFQKDAVRIITVIPLVEQWLQGEGTPDDPWQDQALGQPQMFDNIVWSDRNLGADHYDATGANFEYTIGYYYQPHRNIPYFPFNIMDYYKEKTDENGNTVYYDGKIVYYMPTVPTPEDKRKKPLHTALSYSSSTHKLYPMVDTRLLRMIHQTTGNQYTGKGNPGVHKHEEEEGDYTWLARKKDIDNAYDKNRPQMYIPEEMPKDTYFNFYNGIWNKDDMQWELGSQYQPVSGSWAVPSSEAFMTIFPSTPHAGNFAFRGGGNNADPMENWSAGSSINENTKTLRVTVPYYYEGMEKPAKSFVPKSDATKEEIEKIKSEEQKYKQAWDILKDPKNGIVDPGTTHIGDYTTGPGTDNNLSVEPNGDPEDGYASVYVISRDENATNKKGEKIINKYELPPATKNSDPNKAKYKIRSWGTIYAIKRIYTPQAYRMRWRVVCADGFGTTDNPVPAFYVEVCRYRCKETDELTEENYKDYDWDHPAAKIYFPMCGLGEKGVYYNFGTECNYATSDAINFEGTARVSILQMKVTGDDDCNTYIAVVRDVVDRNYGMQIRPIVGGGSNHQ